MEKETKRVKFLGWKRSVDCHDRNLADIPVTYWTDIPAGKSIIQVARELDNGYEPFLPGFGVTICYPSGRLKTVHAY